MKMIEIIKKNNIVDTFSAHKKKTIFLNMCQNLNKKNEF